MLLESLKRNRVEAERFILLSTARGKITGDIRR